MPPDATRSAAEAAARASYGRLVAHLAVRSRDIAAAEDALADAFVEALSSWPANGVPDQPEAWLLTVARRRLIDARRRSSRIGSVIDDVLISLASDSPVESTPVVIPDDRLRLLFACAHPAIDPAARAPLMLQTVLGLTGEAIASAFVVSPASMSQRLVRAKQRLRDLAISFDLPDEPRELQPRLDSVLDAIYACFTTGWAQSTPIEPDAAETGFAEESLRLARLVIDLMPAEPEPRGLWSLMAHSHARRAARIDDAGAFMPLLEQDPSRWDAKLIREAERELSEAAKMNRPGRFQLEAAIQSAHAQRLHGRSVPWDAVLGLYDALIALQPTLGASVARAASLHHAGRSIEALESLDDIARSLGERIATYQPYHATRAAVLAAISKPAEAVAAYDRAIGLCVDPAARRFLQSRRAAIRAL
jgi:RNA polymerase sigma-70 factor (ECF subfamily)